jgi:hypothetical protein
MSALSGNLLKAQHISKLSLQDSNPSESQASVEDAEKLIILRKIAIIDLIGTQVYEHLKHTKPMLSRPKPVLIGMKHRIA